ncbi:MAG: hypothetical protein MK097_17090, partial [Dechloromonas sp.]|nr:hypothetical protein [Dechloromonas sp.]
MLNIRKLALASVTALVAVGMAMTTPVTADEIEAEEVIVAEEIVEAVVEPCPECPVNNGNVSFAMGNDITSAYFFRGILQEKNGFIWQPWGEISYTVWEASDENSVISDVALTIGNWNSVQTEQTGAYGDGTGAGNWYESDIYAGASVGTQVGVSAGVTYVAYTSPNGAFGTVQEIDLLLAYDDSSLYSGELANLGFSVQPYVLWAFEVDKSAFGDRLGTYMEIGAEPSVSIDTQSDYPVTVSLPLTLGLSLDNYYLPSDAPNGSNPGDDVFGYASIGLGAGVPLAFVPSEFGSLSAGISAQWLTLGSNLQRV